MPAITRVGLGGPMAAYPPFLPKSESEVFSLNLCDADSYSLMPERESYTTMPTRDTRRHCEEPAP
jgi:hypothetical protein